MRERHFPAAAAIAAATALVTEGVVVAAGGAVPDHDWGTRGGVVNGAFIVAAVGLAIATGALPALLHLRRAGQLGAWTSQAGFLAMAVESIASEIHGGNTLGPVFVLGLLLALVGSVIVGVEGALTGAARWIAPLPALGLLVGIAGGDHGGAVVWGLVWLALAWLMTANDPTIGHDAQSLRPTQHSGSSA